MVVPMVRWMRIQVLIACLLSLLLIGPTQALGADALVERVVASVAGKPLLLSTLRQRAEPLIKPAKAQGQKTADLYQAILQQLIDEALIAIKAKELNLSISEADIDRAVANVARQNGITEAELLDEVRRKTTMTTAAYRLELRRQLIEVKLLNAMFGGKGPPEVIVKLRQKLLIDLRRRHSVVVKVRFK